MSKPRGWTVEVSRKQLQNSALYSVDRSKVVEVDLDAVETQVQKTLSESDTTISDFETTEVVSKGIRDNSNISYGDHRRKSDQDYDEIVQYPDAYPYDTNPVISPLEHDKKRLQAWMSSTTMAISQNVKSLANVQRQLLEKSAVCVNPERSPNSSAVTDHSSEIPAEPKSLDLQTLVKPISKPTKCYLDFSEMSTTPSGALSSLDPFVIGKAMDVMKAMNDTDWDKVKHLYEMFRRAGRLDQLIIYEFAIKILVNTRGKSGVVDVLRDIDGDLAEAAFRFGKTLLSLYHGSFLLSEGSEAKRAHEKKEENTDSSLNEEIKKIPISPNRGAQIPENVRKSFECSNKSKESGPKRTSYAYLFKDAAAQQQKFQKKNGQNCSIRKSPCSPFKKCTNRRNSPNTKPYIKQPNPKYAHVKSRYREAAAKVTSQPSTAVPKKCYKKPITAALPTAINKRIFGKENPKIISKQLTGTLSYNPTPPTPEGTLSSSYVSTPDSNMDTTTISFRDILNVSRADDIDKDIVISLERKESRELIDNLKALAKHVKSEDELLVRLGRMSAKAQSLKNEIEVVKKHEDERKYVDEKKKEEIKSAESYYTVKGPTGDHSPENDQSVIEELGSPQDNGDTNSKVILRRSKSEPKLIDKTDSNEKYCLVSDHDGSESNFSVKTLYKQLPNLRPFIIDRLLMNVLLAYLLAVTGGALCADDSNSLYCTLSLTLKGKLRTMLIRALHLVDDF